MAIRQILVPTDFSANATKAAALAAQIASRSGAVVHLVHAFILLESPFTEAAAMRAAWNVQQQREKQALLLLQRQELHEALPLVQVETHLFSGPTQDVLESYVRKHAIDLVVMGTQGASGLAEAIVGSVTADFISRSRLPVLCVPKDFDGAIPHYMVVAVRTADFPQLSLEPVVELAALLQLPVTLLSFAGADSTDTAVHTEAANLEQHCLQLRQAYPHLALHAVSAAGEAFETTLQEYCMHNGVGILCMFTTRRSFWEQFFNPSKTRSMAFHTRVPLLAVPVLPAS